WCGVLRGAPGEACAWSLRLDPSLAAAGEQLRRWHAEGKFVAGARGAATSSAAAHIMAWLAPDVKQFCDQRARLYSPKVRDDFATIRRLLFAEDSTPAEAAAWRKLLEHYGIGYLIVDADDDASLANGLKRLFGSRYWSVRHLAGRTTIFAAAGVNSALVAAPVDVDRRAWQPDDAELAPGFGPRREPRVREWWDAFLSPPADDDPGGSEALVWLACFDGQRETYARHVQTLWRSRLAAGLMMAPIAEGGYSPLLPGWLLTTACWTVNPIGPGAEPPAPLHAAALAIVQRFLAEQDRGPPAAIMLAIRAARRALATNPDDARAWLQLGEAYLRLRYETAERSARAAFEPLDHLRRLQTTSALRHAVVLQPRSLRACANLAGLYQELGYYDLAHAQAAAMLRELERPQDIATTSEELRRSRREYWEEVEQQLARRIRDAQVEIRAPGLERLEAARRALRHGLPAHALELLPRDAVSLGNDGFFLKLSLLLETGQAFAVLHTLEEFRGDSGIPPEYRELHLAAAAAIGNYAAAMDDLRLPEPTVALSAKLTSVAPAAAVRWFIGKHLLDRAGHAWLFETPETVVQQAAAMIFNWQRTADARLLRGIIALERGDITAARTDLQTGLTMFDEQRPSARLARHYLRLLTGRRGLLQGH
ncbi:MAG: hypothetical protein NZO58_10745, partial [Gemmataceae bacterium]|nr:hypothetical protein [Gemmataceae bacterium]